MERVTQRDLRLLLECLAELYALGEGQDFPAQVLRTLPRLVPSDITTYTTFTFPQLRVVNVIHPTEIPGQEILEPRGFEHPVVSHILQRRDAQAIMVSDLVTPRQWHRLWLYNEFVTVQPRLLCQTPGMT